MYVEINEFHCCATTAFQLSTRNALSICYENYATMNIHPDYSKFVIQMK